MTVSEHLELSARAVAAITAKFKAPEYFIEEQSNGCPDGNAVIVVYRRRADRRMRIGFRLDPVGACRMTAAAAGDITLHGALRGWSGR